MNCQNLTEVRDANKALEYTHGGSGENRMSIMSVKPLAALIGWRVSKKLV